MFTAGSQTTQRPSPFNPFATTSTATKANPFASSGSAESVFGSNQKRQASPFDTSNDASKPAAKNPFASAAPAFGHGVKQASGALAQESGAPKNSFASLAAAQQAPTQGFKPSGGFSTNTFGAPSASQPTPPQAASENLDAQQPTQSDDAHGKKVYQQLRKDNISPPAWPSQPGNPSNKGEMAKFREKYEAYRAKVRASLTKAGLIDDPDQRKNLSDAIDFKGICEDMCPQYEMITRITEIDVHQPEKDPSTTFPVTSRMVKKLARSAAGQEAPLPMDVRSIAALRRTFDYLIDDLLQDDSNLPGLHGFLWDRTRAIRRDFTFFSSLTPEELKSQVYVLENTARFHVTALHLLSKEGKAPEDFVEQQELEQLGKALLSLRDVYDDCNDQGIVCENEPEFRAYYLIFHGRDSNIIETLQRQWRPTLWKDSDTVRTAVSLVEAMQTTQDFHGPLKDGPSLAAASAFLTYFKIVEDPSVSYTMACFAECHFPHIRRSILSAIKRGLARPKDTAKDVTAAVLNRFLRFDTIQEAIAFAELHDLEWASDPEQPYDASRKYLVLNNRQAMSHPRLSHHFSQTLVEKKRGSNSLPDIIHRSTFEDPRAARSVVQQPMQEESLFVEDTPDKSSPFSGFSRPSAPPASTEAPAAASSSPFGPKKASPFGANFANGSTPPIPQETPSTFPSQGTTPAANPFASFAKPPAPESQADAAAPSGRTPSFSFEKTKEDVAAQKPPSSFFSTPTDAVSKPQQSETKPTTNSPSPFAPLPAAPASQASPFAAKQPPTSKPHTPLGPPAVSDSSQQQAPAVPSFSSASSAPESGLPATKDDTIAHPTAPSLGSSTNQGSGLGDSPFAAPKLAVPSILGTSFPGSSADTASGSHPATRFSDTRTGASAGSSVGLLPAQPPVAQSQPQNPGPPRDHMGDFAEWFLLGDQGLLDEFKAYMVEDMLSKLYDSFYAEQEEQRRVEEEASLNAEADTFRSYNLALRYFYRWKEHAREKRLRTVRLQAREQARRFYQQQRLAEREAQKKAANRASKEKVQASNVNRPEELKHILKNKKATRRQAQEALLASGILSGIANEQEIAADIVRRENSPFVDGSVDDRRTMRSRSGSGTGSISRGGSKTRALREELLGSGPASFRRSLPSMSASARSSAEPDSSSRKSRVSERWRLKAMGITQMPDGTAMPESLANEILYGNKAYKELGYAGRGTSRSSSRRASIGDGGLADSFAMPPPSSTPISRANNEAASPTKRKRSEDDEEAERRRSGVEQPRANSHKRIMSGAEQVISELRALRMEMEEGSAWFREQNERLQSEAVSRGTTPWDGSIS